MALFVGCFGIVAGASDGGYRVFTFGASGDDFSGLLAMLGGLLLLGVEVVTLWMSRRLDERRRRRYVRRFLIGVAALVVIIEIVFPILFTYGYTHFVHSFVPDADLGVSYEDVRFKTSDGVTLAGWYVPSKNRAAVIVFPAAGRSEGHEHVRMLARHDYGVLIFDPRGTGESNGDPERWGGERDVKAAIAYLRTRSEVDPSRIGGLEHTPGGRLRGRRHSHDPRSAGQVRTSTMAHSAILGDLDRSLRRFLEPDAAPRSRRPRQPDLAAASVLDLLRPSGRW
jgi:hypothetical protein